MPDTDRILEAEQSIQSIASELKRMRDAANLLESSQAKTDAVLSSAQKVVQATERFSNECGIIVTKLAATDLNQRLDDLQTLHSELESASGVLAEALRSAVGELQGGIQAATGSISEAMKAAYEQSHADSAQLAALLEERIKSVNAAISKIESQLNDLANRQESIAKGAKARQITMMVIVILAFLVSLAIFAKAFVPNLGG